MTQTLKLVSNFTDYYDHHMDLDSENVWRRLGTDGLDRHGQLCLLEKNGIAVPPWGVVRQLISKQPACGYPEVRRPKLSRNCKKLVVYTDIKAHCAEGKVLVSLDEAMAKYPDNFAIEYLEGFPGRSWRYLQIGLHGFIIECHSIEDWRSNYGDGDETVTNHVEGWCNHELVKNFVLKLPLFAIDFVLDTNKKMYAVDFNVAPGVRGTGVERELPPKFAAETIKKAYFEGTYSQDVKRYYIN